MAAEASWFDLLELGNQGWGIPLLRGAALTLEISASAFVIGLGIGLGVATAKLKGNRLARVIADGYTTACRALPELLLIILLYYSGSTALEALLSLLGLEHAVSINAFATAVVVLGIVHGAYMAEVLRGAILAVPVGQIEAARAFGFSPATLLVRVTLPAMLPLALGGLGNLWLILLKDSALISVVGFSELMFTSQQAAASTHRYFLFFLAAGLIYLVMSLVSTAVIRALERRVRRGVPVGHA